MRLRVFVIGISMLATVGCSTASAGEPNKAPKKEQAAAPAEVTVEQADKSFQAKKAVPVDANGKRTREKYGTVPGAILLSSGQFDAGKELPNDKSTELVFYCGNTMCSASDSAAERAMQAGYKNVKVMRAGIKGWADAGKKVSGKKS